MGRRAGVFLALIVAVVAFVGVTEWLAERRSAEVEVAWSPLYERRALDALTPWTAQPVYAGLQEESTVYRCQEVTMAPTCKGGPTCEGQTCGGGPTCDGPTCEGPTCEGPTCEGPTCALPTCSPGGTCWDSCTYGTPTCDANGTCQSPTCVGPTCLAGTCVGPTCLAGTCDGGTCWDVECHTISPAVTFCDTCDRKWCLPTLEGGTCTRPTCGGPTCDGSTCDGPTCFQTQCDVLDYGDAPEASGTDSHYATTLASDGARHIIDGVYYLGVREDVESDGQPAVFALGDDDEPYQMGDDEDGIWFSTTFNPGRKAAVVVAASQAGRLFAWIDYDMSGTWTEDGDVVFPEGVDLVPGLNVVVIAVPEAAVGAPLSYVRFRFTKSDTLLSTGEAENGEVEDYRVPICAKFQGWVMTDQVLYGSGDPVRINFYVNEICQVTLVRHRGDGTADVLWTSTVEVGLHQYPESGGTLAATAPTGTSTVELIATSLQSGNTAWLTTPYVVGQ